MQQVHPDKDDVEEVDWWGGGGNQESTRGDLHDLFEKDIMGQNHFVLVLLNNYLSHYTKNLYTTKL